MTPPADGRFPTTHWRASAKEPVRKRATERTLHHAPDVAIPTPNAILPPMSITATVENDTIKLPPGVHLPDGTEVTISPKSRAIAETELPTLAEAFQGFIGCVNSGVGDLAENHDHYAHGAPKGIDRL